MLGSMDAAAAEACRIAAAEIKKHTSSDVTVELKNIPSSWANWVRKVGINSLCVDQTWGFIDDDRKKALWNERGIKTIVMEVEEKPDEDDKWISAWVEYEGSTMTIYWYPRAGQWGASSNAWNESGYRTWWNLCDEITFGLQLYQLEGECFYKSDWLNGFEDPDPDALLPGGTKKFKRWFEFRHWIIYWYQESRSGWNWKATKNPPPLPDGSPFNLNSVLSLPSMPNLELPRIQLPNLPDVVLPSLPDAPSLSLPSAPSLPSMPSLSMPSLSMPSLSAPSAPDLSKVSLPSFPKGPQRPKSRWACHGFIEIGGLNCKAKGSTLVLSDAKVTHFWEAGNGSVRRETKEHQRFELECSDATQADSWVKSLVPSGCKEGDVGGCCTLA